MLSRRLAQYILLYSLFFTFSLNLTEALAETVLDRAAALALIDENGHAEIPDTYTSITDGAFNSTNLVSVTIPNSITHIGHIAFASNDLIEVEIPSSVISMDGYAFAWNHQLNKLTLTSSLSGQNVFMSSGLSSLTVPSPISYIPYQAFSYNESLETIIIDETVTEIGENAFENVSADIYIIGAAINHLTVNDFPSNSDFFGCTHLGQNGVPQNCEEIWINLTPTNLDRAAALALIDENGHAEIPDTYTSITDGAFNSTNLVSVTIPNSITHIGHIAFASNDLIEVEIPSSVISMDGYAFAWNHQLNKLTLTSSLSGQNVFMSSGLSSLTVPSPISYIPYQAFSYNESLETIIIDETVTEIGENAFENVSADIYIIGAAINHLTVNDFPSNSDFFGCTHLGQNGVPQNCEEIWINLTPTNLDRAAALALIDENGHAEIPDTYTSITDGAFNSTNLVSVTIPNSITHIGHIAFASNDLIEVEIPSSVISMDGYAFAWNHQLNKLTLTSSLSGQNVFMSSGLSSLTVPSPISYIPYQAFSYNESLETIIIDETVTEIGENAFENVSADIYIIGAAINHLTVNDFPSNSDFFGCTHLGQNGVPQNCEEIWSHTHTNFSYITFAVDMTGVDLGGNIPALQGSFNGWCGICGNLMHDDDDDNIWEFSVEILSGYHEYKYTIGEYIDEDSAPDSCGSADIYKNRPLIVAGDEVLLVTPWNGCPVTQVDETYSDPDPNGDVIANSVDPDPLDSELQYYSVSDIPNLVPDQTLRDCLTNLASGAENLGHISDVYCSSRNDDAEDLTPIASLEGLQYFPNLTHLWIDSSKISSLAPISNLINLVSLTVDNGQNSVSDLTPLLALNNLEFLHLQNGSLTEDMLQPITQLSKLKQLGLFENQIEDISFLTSLGNDIEELHVAGNPIQDFSPVASLTSLKKFYGYYNPMDNLNYLSDLQNLEVIGISETGISDITVLKDLPNLIDVRLNGNPIRRVSGIFTNMESGSININDTQIWCHEYDELMAEIATDVEVIYDSSCILDSDQDGFSDQFETDYGLDPFTATLDIDQDGVPNEDDSDNDNDGLPDEHDFAPFDPSNESESIIVFENGIVGAEWGDGIRAYDESIDWNSCLVPEGCPSIDWAIINDEERGDVLEVTHLGGDSGAGIFISTSNSVDLRGARENGVLRFDIKVLQGSSDLFISADCGWPCAGGQQRVQVSNQNEWQSLLISVEDLIPNGPNGSQLDLNIVKSAIVIEVGQGSSFRIDNIIYDCQSAACDGSNLPINEDAEFTYEFIEDGIELTGCQGQCPSELIIPESIDGYAVTSIGYRAFYSNQSSDYSSRINTVHIPSSIKVIGAGAFQHNRLETLTIPEGVVRIEDQAFLNNSLTSVTLPDSLNFIGSGAFLANNLTSINNLNQSIIFGGGDQGSFDVNPGIDNGEWRYFPLLDEVILFGCSQECSTDLVIPEYIDDLKVIRIGEGAFENQQLNSVIIPPNVSQIGAFAFAENNLTAVNLPIDLELISQGAFESNPLETIYYCDETYNGGDIEGITPQYNESCDLGQGNDDVSSPYQSVAIKSEPVGLLGENLKLTVSYDVSDGEDDLTGLGLRMHYDSSVLTFVTFDSVLESNNISALGPIQDTQDIDNDSSTDQYISASWASLYIDWPGGLPADLFNAIFEVSNNETLSQTDINFSAISTTAGYGFSGEPYNLNIIAGSWDFDGNGAVDALTDGLLLLRHAFGLSGSTLTDFAVSPDSPNTATEIETHMNRIMSIADIDGDGNVDALTDGLLLLRYAFEVRGDNLVENVISDNATRTSSVEIESYIEAHMP